jgi:hypothetical protein
MTITLNHVISVTETLEEGVYNVLCNFTDANNVTQEEVHCSRPTDTFGIGPEIRQWLEDNPDFPIDPYVPPTTEQLREWMFPLTARQFRLGLIAGNITPEQITAVIDAMADGPDKVTAQIEWEYATTFTRMHPLVAQLSAALGLTPEQVDTLWTNALTL